MKHEEKLEENFSHLEISQHDKHQHSEHQVEEPQQHYNEHEHENDY